MNYQHPYSSLKCHVILNAKIVDSKNGNYVRLLFIDYSSTFNTIVPIKLAFKLTDLGLNSSLCDWIQDFLTGRPQVVKVGQFTSNSITLNVGAPQGCVLSPLLYSLYTHTTVCPLTAPHLSSNWLMILWFWAKLKSWLWTSGRDSNGPTVLLWSVGPLWRGWAASSTSV